MHAVGREPRRTAGQRPVGVVGVAVAVEEVDPALEARRLVHQGLHPGLERADVVPGGRVRRVEHVGLLHHHHATVVPLAGGGEGLVQLVDVGGDPVPDGLALLGGRLGVPEAAPRLEAVVAAGHVGGQKGDAGAAVGDVLGEPPPGLRGDGEGRLPQGRPGVVEEDLPHLRQPLERVVGTVVRAVAVGPLVVTRRVDQRVLEGVEVAADQPEVVVAADRRAVLDVAEVDDRADGRVLVDLLDPPREGGDLGVAVRHVADDREGVAARRPDPVRTGATAEAGRRPAGLRAVRARDVGRGAWVSSERGAAVEPLGPRMNGA